VQPIAAGFAAIDGDLLDTARLLGSRGVELLFRVLAPLSKRSIVAACVLSFAHTIGEFGVVLMLGGGIPGQTKTLSISIYDQVQVFDYASANRTSLLLIVVSFVALLFLYGRRRTMNA
jgi:molybdate transport system permease protein